MAWIGSFIRPTIKLDIYNKSIELAHLCFLITLYLINMCILIDLVSSEEVTHVSRPLYAKLTAWVTNIYCT